MHTDTFRLIPLLSLIFEDIGAKEVITIIIIITLESM